MIKKQTDLFLSKLAIQYERVSRKFKQSKNEKELSNSEVQLACIQYHACNGQVSEYGEQQLEWLHDRLTRLSKTQMKLYTLRFVEGKTMQEIAKVFKVTDSAIDRRLQRMYAILRKG